MDPVTNSILAAAHDCAESDPLKHAVMVAIDMIAWLQGSGAYNLKYKINDNGYCIIDCNFSANDISISNSKISNNLKTGYLCTGYDIYLSHEPCVM